MRRLLLITLLLAASTAAYSEVGTANCVLKIDGKLLVNERTPCAVRLAANGVYLQTKKYQAGVEAGGDERGLFGMPTGTPATATFHSASDSVRLSEKGTASPITGWSFALTISRKSLDQRKAANRSRTNR